jgi:bloom syndrome protein
MTGIDTTNTPTTRHEQAKRKSYVLLEHARSAALAIGDGNSRNLREELARLLVENFEHAPYSWQLDVAEALCLGLDTIVVAGTGEGKTLPFVMPLLLDEMKKAIIISPLIALQQDHVRKTMNYLDIRTYIEKIDG